MEQIEVTSCITVGHDEATTLASKRIRIPDSFIQQRDKSALKALGAVASLHLIWVCDVTHMVVTVGLPIPAAREHKFHAHTVRAIGIQIGFIREKMSHERWLWELAVIHAVETNRFLTKGTLSFLFIRPLMRRRIGHGKGESPTRRFTSDDLKSGREWYNLIAKEEVVSMLLLVDILSLLVRRAIRVLTQACHQPASQALYRRCRAGSKGLESNTQTSLA